MSPMLDVPKHILGEVPARIALHYNVLPVGIEAGVLKLLAPAELGRETKDELRIVLARELCFEPAARRELAEAIARAYGVGAGTIEALTGAAKSRIVPAQTEGVDAEAGEPGTVARLVNELLSDAIARRASDIHIEPFEKVFRIRYRVDGLLREPRVPEEIRLLAPSLVSRVKIMAALDIGEKRLPQDGRIRIRKAGEDFDVRVSVLPSSHGEAIVLRILKPLELLGLEALGFEPDALAGLRGLLRNPHGMILLTGPTGSGKTTTLYACLKELNSAERKIITIEDPVEYKLPGAVQMQVHPKIDFGFAPALRAVLRHDPDCIMVGEIRDAETAAIAVRAALTGHLVLSTLHTNDAASAPVRLAEMGVEPHLIASSLRAVIAQRLVRRACPPCEKCDGSGFFGRTIVYEMLAVSETLRDCIVQKRPAPAIREAAIREGMAPLEETGRRKVSQFMTRPEELDRVLA